MKLIVLGFFLNLDLIFGDLRLILFIIQFFDCPRLSFILYNIYHTVLYFEKHQSILKRKLFCFVFKNEMKQN